MNDIEIIKNITDWPADAIYVKRSSKQNGKYDQQGMIHKNNLVIVFLFDGITNFTYDTVEEMVKDGWLID